jgi:hypothetical protein
MSIPRVGALSCIGAFAVVARFTVGLVFIDARSVEFRNVKKIRPANGGAHNYLR